MKFTIRKETALKGLLFVALAGNVSFFKPALESLDLASETVGGRKVVAPVIPANNSLEAAPNPNAAKASDKGIRPDEPARAEAQPEAKAEARELKEGQPEVKRICGFDFYVAYKEVEGKDGEIKTRLSVRPHMGAVPAMTEKGVAWDVVGDLDTNLNNESAKASIDRKLENSLRGKLGRACEEEVVDREERPSRRETRESRRERLTPSPVDCDRDSRGRPLSGEDMLTCKLDALSELEIDDSERSQSRAMRKIEAIVNGDLRKGIKHLLMSQNEEDNQRGEELVEELSERLNDLAAENNLDFRRMSTLIQKTKALQTGSSAFHESVDMREDLLAQKKDMQAQMSMVEQEAKANPQDRIAQMQLQEMQQQMRMQIDAMYQQTQTLSQGSYGDLENLRRQGMMNLTEFNEFSQPYKTMMNDLRMLSPRFGQGNQGLLGPTLGLDSGGGTMFNNGPTLTLNNGTQFMPNQGLMGPQNQNFMGPSYMNPTLMRPQQVTPFNSSVGWQQPFRPGMNNGPMFLSPTNTGFRTF